jgi:hypothetical protein
LVKAAQENIFLINILNFDQGDQKIRIKNRQIFQRIAQKVAKSKKGQKYLQQSSI